MDSVPYETIILIAVVLVFVAFIAFIVAKTRGTFQGRAGPLELKSQAESPPTATIQGSTGRNVTAHSTGDASIKDSHAVGGHLVANAGTAPIGDGIRDNGDKHDPARDADAGRRS